LLLRFQQTLEQDSTMQEALLKARTRRTSLKNSEFYELRLFETRANGERTYFVRETHGRWDDRKGRVVYDRDSLLPLEGFQKYEDAKERCSQQWLTLARAGFVHSLVWHSSVDRHSEYRLIA